MYYDIEFKEHPKRPFPYTSTAEVISIAPEKQLIVPELKLKVNSVQITETSIHITCENTETGKTCTKKVDYRDALLMNNALSQIFQKETKPAVKEYFCPNCGHLLEKVDTKSTVRDGLPDYMQTKYICNECYAELCYAELEAKKDLTRGLKPCAWFMDRDEIWAYIPKYGRWERKV